MYHIQASARYESGTLDLHASTLEKAIEMAEAIEPAYFDAVFITEVRVDNAEGDTRPPVWWKAF